jgi:hypothetical protein
MKSLVRAEWVQVGTYSLLALLVLGWTELGSWAEPLALLCFLSAAACAFSLLRRATRGRASAVALLGGVACVATALWIHDTLRGERPDPGRPPPRVARRAHPVGGRPPASADRPVRLVVWGDCRNSTAVQDRLVEALRQRQPDLTVGLGDFVGMARRYQFQLLEGRLKSAGVPFYLVPGNHDRDPFGTLKPYGYVFGAPNWSFEYRAVGFLGLDASLGRVDPIDVTWLEQEIERLRPDVKHLFLFCHYPLFPPAGHPKKALPDDEATQRLRALAEREGLTVCSGNFHGYDVQRHGRVLQVITGGAGSRPEAETPYHCVAVEAGDEVRVEQVVLAQHHEVSELAERFRVLREEGVYATGKLRVRSLVVVTGLAMFLGGIVAACWRRRSPHSSSASSA